MNYAHAHGARARARARPQRVRTRWACLTALIPLVVVLVGLITSYLVFKSVADLLVGAI